MDHDDVLEQLELAAVEPDGLDRLMAGDTAIAAAIAGHLAGCEACSREFQRLGRAAPLLRDVVRTTPAPELRDRTLAFVREYGVLRGEAAAAVATAGEPGSGHAGSAPAARQGSGRLLPWVAGLAAVVALTVAGLSLFVAQGTAQRVADQERAIRGLEAVTSATIEISAQPDHERVTLAATGGASSGSLLFSAATTELVVVARGLDRPPAGKEYRCWVELAGKRENVGRMFFGDELAFWVGDTPAIRGATPGTWFGVSLADLDSPAIDAPPVIAGEL